MTETRPLLWFAHHQGQGHLQRAHAIISCLPVERRVTMVTAAETVDPGLAARVDVVRLPEMIGAPSRTPALHDQPAPSIMHCVPLGVREQQLHMAAIAATIAAIDPALFIIDVSAEIALLARILSVPAVSMRMHGDRLDAGHMAAYEASAGMLAPFSAKIEQEDYPDWARMRTCYTGGLCTTETPVLEKADARARLNLPKDRRIVTIMTGGGGSGTPWAPLTMAARAEPDMLFLAIGPVHREGHETEFANLRHVGWTDKVTDYLAAADLVIASAGDNTVHEIARIGRPFICAPEWRYFDEQLRKAERLDAAGAAIAMLQWPGSFSGWQDILRRAETVDLAAQQALFDPNAAQRAADWIEGLATDLWLGK